MLVFEGDHVGNQRSGRRRTDTNVYDFGDFPEFEEDSHTLGGEDHPGCVFVVVEEVEENYGLHEYVSKDGSDRDSDVVFLVAEM